MVASDPSKVMVRVRISYFAHLHKNKLGYKRGYTAIDKIKWVKFLISPVFLKKN